jgi:hypothetical protein
MAEPDLATLQHWMQSRIVTDALPGDAAQAARTLAVHDVVRGSPALPADARMRIYATSYALRLLECLRAEFPVLHALVGDRVFDLFATAYLSRFHSHAPTLYDLGAAFADFLDATRPPDGAGRGALDAIPASLARLERAISEAGRAAGPESQSSQALAAPALLLLAPGQRLRLPDCVRLLRLDFDFTSALAASQRGERPSLPPAAETCIVVARSRYRVQVHALSPARFAWLEALGHDGADAMLALAHVRAAVGTAADGLVADVMTWLPIAIDAGLLVTTDAG